MSISLVNPAGIAFANAGNNGVLVRGTASTVTSNTLTTIATLAANGVRFITRIICSGEENARWQVETGSTVRFAKRTVDRNAIFDFDIPFKLDASTALDVKATHHGPDGTADFEATVLGYTA